MPGLSGPVFFYELLSFKKWFGISFSFGGDLIIDFAFVKVAGRVGLIHPFPDSVLAAGGVSLKIGYLSVSSIGGRHDVFLLMV